MSTHTLFSRLNSNRGALRMRLAQITQVFFVLVFLASQLGMNTH